MKISILTQALCILVFSTGCSNLKSLGREEVAKGQVDTKFNNPYIVEEIKPVIWGCNFTSATQKVTAFENGTLPPHPLDLGRYLFFASSKYKSGETDYKELVDRYLRLIEELSNDSTYFRGNTFRYDFAHEDIPAGWWSGMANSALILGLSYSSDLGDDYTQITEKLIQNLHQDYTLGGSSQTDEFGNKWMLEYAWDGMTEKDIKNVLNGFLFSLVCVGLADKVNPDPRLKELAQSGLNRYKRVRGQFHFEKISWTKYDLQPTIEPPHYAIFDLILLKSLGAIFPQEHDWIHAEIQRRQKVLKESYRFDMKRRGDKHILLFNLIGAPNPYWIDTYPLRMDLRFTDNSNDFSVSSYPPRDFSLDVSKRGFLEVILSEKQFNTIQAISVNSVYSGLETEIFSVDKSEVSFLVKEVEARSVGLEPLTFYDSSLQEGRIIVNPEHEAFPDQKTYRNEIGVIAWDFTDTLHLNEHQHILIAVDLAGAIASHKFYLFQADGSVSERYYIPLEAGPNLIVLNPVGFKGYKKGSRIKRLAWRIYTNRMEEELTIHVRGAYWAKNNFQLKSLLADPEFQFKEKEEKGNIY
jgi:hypothetical protein